MKIARTLLLPLAILMPVSALHAVIDITDAPMPDSFDIKPLLAGGSWATQKVGTAGVGLTTAAFDTKVMAAADVTAIATELGDGATIPPNTADIARWNAGTATVPLGIKFLQTRPTGEDYILLKATLVNATAAPLDAVRIAYDYSKANHQAAEDVPGLRVFWSTSGTPGTWAPLPDLSIDPGAVATYSAPLPVSTILTLPAPLAVGGNLYIIWADQNSTTSTTDASYHIDNFAASSGVVVDCTITGTANTVTRLSGVDPTDPADDKVSFNANITGTGAALSPTWTITGPASIAGTTGSYGVDTPVQVAVSDFAAGMVQIRVSDTGSPTCSTSFNITTTRVIGTNVIAGNLPILTSAPLTTGWVVNDATRTATQNNPTQADHVIDSETIDLTGIGEVAVSAHLDAIAGTSSGFEAADEFRLEVIIDGGAPVSILGTADIDANGRLIGAVTNNLPGNWVELPDAGDTSVTASFNLNYIIPAAANNVVIRITGNSNSGSETYVVNDVKLSAPAPLLFAVAGGTSTFDHKGTVNPADDEFTSFVNVTAFNVGASTGWKSNETPERTGLYATPNPVTFGPFPVSGGARTVTLTDALDAGVTSAPLVLQRPTPTLTATLVAGSIARQENGAGDADDTVTFNINIAGTNTGPEFTATPVFVPSTVTGAGALPAAATPVLLTLHNVPNSAMTINVVIADASYPTAPAPINIAVAVPAPTTAGPYILGQKNFGSLSDLTTTGALPPEWHNFPTVRESVMTTGVAGDSIVASEVLDLTTTGAVNFSAKLIAKENSAGTNFEIGDKFKAELLINGGLVPADIINLVDAFDVGDGASATAAATNGANGPKNGYINGYTGTAALDLVSNINYTVAEEEYNANKARDEFNTGGQVGDALLNNTINLSAVIPAGADSVQLKIYGAGVSGSEALIVSDVLFTTAVGVVDSDGDGVSDAFEAIMGTNPGNPTDVLRLTQNPANANQITFPTKPGRFYRVYVSDDAVEASHLQVWKDSGLATISGDLSPSGSFNITVSAGEARRFYRVHVMVTDGTTGIGDWPATVP